MIAVLLGAEAHPEAQAHYLQLAAELNRFLWMRRALSLSNVFKV